MITKPCGYLSVILLCFSLLGCGKKFVYDNLDWFLLGQLDDLISLSRSQELLVEPALGSLLDWHKQEELPQYAVQLERLSSLNLNQLTIEEYQGRAPCASFDDATLS
ncbi:hypothetical protein DZ860_01355 [Vibrio sinensis]|uniref:Uncharacterized protein n=1 Tax=Vibrio sinensis TaxID=2302434 RepID=A0A3A6R2J4_9VIBR|nr:hypothetical protein [Vibrio sinensis]RJX75357.1 hypothetical protein DZ860_01355 [Vibrio sinensis]